MRNILMVFLIPLLAINPCAYAETTNNGCETQINCMNGTQTGPAPIEERPAAGTTVTTTTTTGLGTGGSGAYSQAQAAKKEADNKNMLAMMMAMAMLPVCMNPQTAQIGCPLMAAALMAAAAAKGKSGEAQGLMNQLGGTGSGTNTTADTVTTTDTGGVTAGDVDKMNNALKKNGYSLDGEGGITMPNGSTVAGDLNKQSLMNAGVSAADAGKIQAGIEKMKKDMAEKMAIASEDLNKGGEGGGGGGGSSTLGSDRSTASTGGAAEADPSKDPNHWNGFFKKYGDSAIGVANNDIFMMVEKRVESERKVMGH